MTKYIDFIEYFILGKVCAASAEQAKIFGAWTLLQQEMFIFCDRLRPGEKSFHRAS
jgi:hypothetical protein